MDKNHLIIPIKSAQGKSGILLHLCYSFAETPFGTMLIASTQQGLCSASLSKDGAKARESLRKKFPEANFEAKTTSLHEDFLKIFDKKPVKLTFHLKGTPFQLKVWNALLEIPFGQTTTYGSIAAVIKSPNAYRAVGTAVGNNPIIFAIPCHRVLPASGDIGQYYWGPEIKQRMLNWESDHR
jgi:AraC family transcriptional regulator, regulatory protein of adaptative response / methylated-DNA-[protein]-cysteine methyltransferase